MRLIEFRDEESGKTYQFITNNFRIAASSIAEIYKQRWQIELFFKWIKQNLKIKSFLGTSKNAVMSQIWVAMIHYLLIAYLKFCMGSSWGWRSWQTVFVIPWCKINLCWKFCRLTEKSLKSRQTGICQSKRNFSAHYCSKIFTGQQCVWIEKYKCNRILSNMRRI